MEIWWVEMVWSPAMLYRLEFGKNKNDSRIKVLNYFRNKMNKKATQWQKCNDGDDDHDNDDGNEVFKKIWLWIGSLNLRNGKEDEIPSIEI